MSHSSRGQKYIKKNIVDLKSNERLASNLERDKGSLFPDSSPSLIIHSVFIVAYASFWFNQLSDGFNEIQNSVLCLVMYIPGVGENIEEHVDGFWSTKKIVSKKRYVKSMAALSKKSVSKML